MFQALLSAPNPDDPLANDVAELWKVNYCYGQEAMFKVVMTGILQMNEAEALKNARDWTRKYAMGAGSGNQMAVTQPVQGWGHLAASNIYFMKIIVIQNCQVISF